MHGRIPSPDRIDESTRRYVQERSRWHHLGNQNFDALLAGAVIRHVDQDAVLKPCIGLVMTGILGVVRTISDGRRVYCALFHGGDLIDLRRKSRQPEGALTAVTASDILVLDEEQFDKQTSDSPELAQLVIDELREHLARLRDHCTDIACKTPMERLACMLLEFRKWEETEMAGSSGDSMHMPIRQSDIADYIGVTPATVSRTFRKLAEEHLIRQIGTETVVLLDIPSLRRLANGGRPRRSTRK